MADQIEINSILKDFYEISGIRISIHDTEFNEIYAYPRNISRYCSFIQQYENVRNECLFQDRKGFEIAQQTDKVYVYKCKMGLYEAVVPLYSFGVCSGYLMMGQVCDRDKFSIDNIYRNTLDIVKDQSDAKAICDDIPCIDREKINSYINIMKLLAEYLTGTNRAFSSNNELSKLIKEYINRNYSSKITLEVLSKKFGYCNATLMKTFKSKYNTTIMDYLNKVRIEKAAELVKTSPYSFAQISSKCGFYDQNYFSKTFKKYYKMSPSEYKKRHNNLSYT